MSAMKDPHNSVSTGMAKATAGMHKGHWLAAAVTLWRPSCMFLTRIHDINIAGMAKATASTEKAHWLAASVTREVRNGGLAARLSGGRRRQKPSARRPYSPWLAQPYAKVLLFLSFIPSTLSFVSCSHARSPFTWPSICIAFFRLLLLEARRLSIRTQLQARACREPPGSR